MGFSTKCVQASLLPEKRESLQQRPMLPYAVQTRRGSGLNDTPQAEQWLIRQLLWEQS